ncbi:major facilitator superfamily transporter [Astrocystis sublimbata]|nr:major facilitator superfamily transporter [Astrocystis sublimbata]
MLSNPKKSFEGSASHKEMGSKQIEELAEIVVPIENCELLRDKTNDELAAIERSLVRKLDYRFLPGVCFMLLLEYLDRINVSNARLAGMQDDLGLSDVQWSLGISLFYIGYIVSQVPTNVLLAKSQPRYVMSTMMLAWSVTTIKAAAIKDGRAFMLLRFLCGLFEGPFIPAVALVTSSWYTRAENPLRMRIWYAGNIVSTVVSGLLAAGNLQGVGGLASWRWFFLLEGAASVVVGAAAFFFIPNFPDNTGTFFFTPEESEMARYRQAKDSGGLCEDDECGPWEGVWLAAHFFIIIGQSYKDFFPSIVNTFHFFKTGTYLLQAPPYAFAYLFTLFVSWSAGRVGEHCWHMVGSLIAGLVGAILLISTLSTGPRYFGTFILAAGPFLALNLQISWETSVVPRPRAKRAIANAVSSISHWFTPYFFLSYQEPRYQTGGGIIITGIGAAIVMCVITRSWSVRKNKQLDAREAEIGDLTY